MAGIHGGAALELMMFSLSEHESGSILMLVRGAV